MGSLKIYNDQNFRIIYKHKAHAMVTHSEGSPVGTRKSRVCSLTAFIWVRLTEERCQLV